MRAYFPVFALLLLGISVAARADEPRNSPHSVTRSLIQQIKAADPIGIRIYSSNELSNIYGTPSGAQFLQNWLADFQEFKMSEPKIVRLEQDHEGHILAVISSHRVLAKSSAANISPLRFQVETRCIASFPIFSSGPDHHCTVTKFSETGLPSLR